MSLGSLLNWLDNRILLNINKTIMAYTCIPTERYYKIKSSSLKHVELNINDGQVNLKKRHHIILLSFFFLFIFILC